jgi:hypothetical protein
MGFSLHADTAVHGHDRQGLERLCRSGVRGAVADDAACPDSGCAVCRAATRAAAFLKQK